MRGRQEPEVTMQAFVDLEAPVSPYHPLRTIKVQAGQALAGTVAGVRPHVSRGGPTLRPSGVVAENRGAHRPLLRPEWAGFS